MNKNISLSIFINEYPTWRKSTEKENKKEKKKTHLISNEKKKHALYNKVRKHALYNKEIKRRCVI